jgi:pimeloyl-ACP methyl ester carboxylesterase
VPYIESAGARIHYEVHDGGTGTALLLSHAYAATCHMWDPNIAALSSDRTVVTWDMRGHGDSDSPADPAEYSEELSLADMAGILDAAGIQNAVIGGLSLGGYLSLAFHLASPERVAALVLCDTGPGYRRDEPRAEWNAMAFRRADRFEERGLDALGKSAEVRLGTHRSAEGLAKAARGILAQRDSRVIDSLPDIKVPTLVVVGADDKAYVAPAEVMVAKIPGAAKVVIEKAGHAVNIDQPDEFDRAVRDFLQSI